MSDANKPFAGEQIATLKQTKAQGLFERTFPAGATEKDLDLDLISSLLKKMSLASNPREFLQKHRLVQKRNGHAIPCLAGLVLFGKDPLLWHPRCGIDFVRWEGTERQHGAELNVSKRIRIEYPLAILIEKAYESIRPFIRERQQLHDLFSRNGSSTQPLFGRRISSMPLGTGTTAFRVLRLKSGCLTITSRFEVPACHRIPSR